MYPAMISEQLADISAKYYEPEALSLSETNLVWVTKSQERVLSNIILFSTRTKESLVTQICVLKKLV